MARIWVNVGREGLHRREFAAKYRFKVLGARNWAHNIGNGSFLTSWRKPRYSRWPVQPKPKTPARLSNSSKPWKVRLAMHS